MVFQKQLNPEGEYIDNEGKRYEILSCQRTESRGYVQTGTATQVIDGKPVEIPILEPRIFINKGWDAFENEEAAARAYGLTYAPQEEIV